METAEETEEVLEDEENVEAKDADAQTDEE